MIRELVNKCREHMSRNTIIAKKECSSYFSNKKFLIELANINDTKIDNRENITLVGKPAIGSLLLCILSKKQRDEIFKYPNKLKAGQLIWVKGEFKKFITTHHFSTEAIGLKNCEYVLADPEND